MNAGSVVGGTLNPIASPIEVDVEQSLLDTVNLTRQVNLNYDELRIGSSLDDVLAIPEPSAALLLGFGALGLLRRWRRR